MKALIAIIALTAALAASDADAARYHRRQQRLWSPGIFIHLAREYAGTHLSGPRMVWRGDWVPAYMVK